MANRDNLIKREPKLVKIGVLCGFDEETTNHLFLGCMVGW